jgi:hypothetical protein
MPVPTAMSTPTVKPTAVETAEVARMCKTVEIRWMSELMAFLAAAEKGRLVRRSWFHSVFRVFGKFHVRLRIVHEWAVP